MKVLGRRLLAEGLGTALLVATVVGSGIMAERLAGGNRSHCSPRQHHSHWRYSGGNYNHPRAGFRRSFQSSSYSDIRDPW